MQILTPIPFTLDPARLMGAAHVDPDGDDAEDFAALVSLARGIAVPKACYREVFVDEHRDDGVTIEGISFTSQALARNLEGVGRVFPYIATCGMEMDERFDSRGDILREFWWDGIKMAVLDAARRHFLEHVRRRYGLEKTAAMAPGSGDADVWPITQQRELFSLLGDVRGAVGVRLTDSCLMVPNKTISGILFPTERAFRSCQLCHRDTCPSRAAAFDQTLWDELQHD